ncbi:hypothetical protein EJB05_22211, partial [Eragrostis curvula]
MEIGRRGIGARGNLLSPTTSPPPPPLAPPPQPRPNPSPPLSLTSSSFFGGVRAGKQGAAGGSSSRAALLLPYLADLYGDPAIPFAKRASSGCGEEGGIDVVDMEVRLMATTRLRLLNDCSPAGTGSRPLFRFKDAGAKVIGELMKESRDLMNADDFWFPPP